MLKRKNILFAGLSIFAVIVLIIGFLVIKWAFNNLDPLRKAQQAVSIAVQMKDLNEKELEKYNPKSQRAVDVKHYLINLDLYPEQEKIIGDVTISLKINDKQSDRFEINLYDNFEIREIQINGEHAEYEQTGKVLTVLKKNKEFDSADVRIKYEGTPKSLGFGSFKFVEVDGHLQTYTLSEPIFASTWFPCIDLPDDKALLDIYVTNDSSNISLSNGKLLDVKSNKTRRTYHWKTFYPIATYLIAVYSGNYKTFSEKYRSVSGDSLNIAYYALPKNIDDAKKDFSGHSSYIKVFEELFGPYPFIKEKYSVAEFWWQGGAMENQTLTGIGSNFISGLRLSTDVLIHELSHHWWGDAVTPKTWKDIWLNEGFATYSVALYWEKQAGFSALQSTMMTRSLIPDGTLYNPGNALFSGLIYNKGAWVLHMLRKEVGDDIFFKILKEYFLKYKYGNASTDDFKNLCEKISKKNLNQFFNQWVYKGEGIIEIEADWKQIQSNNLEIRIKQLQKGYDIYKFPIDIKLIYDKQDDFNVSTVYVSSKDTVINIQSKKKPSKVIFDPDKWLLKRIILINHN
ncbi:MAG: M1 family metallopeptidase [Melioribacter sp.]|nr:M1 family metallopeptidase [Melioribacter sp.]